MSVDRPFLTAEVARAAVAADLDAVDAALARLRETSTDLVGNAFRVEVADRLETQLRVIGGLSYRMFAELADPPDGDDRPVTRPDCTAGGYDCEVHHTPDWYPDGATYADTLHFACPRDHKLVTDGHASTTVTDDGRLAWTIGDDPPAVNPSTTTMNCSTTTSARAKGPRLGTWRP